MAGELNVYGTFSAGPWPTNQAIIEAAAKGAWNPSTVELKVIAESGKGKSEQLVNAFNFLCAIIRKKPDRINLFVHANSRYIYFKGRVIPGDVDFDTSADANELDVDFLAGQELNDIGFKDGITHTATYADLRKALSPRTILNLYACHTALGGEQCKVIAKYFRINVRGFSDSVLYWPTLTKSGGLTMKYSIGTGNPKVDDFHDLDKHFSAPFTP